MKHKYRFLSIGLTLGFFLGNIIDLKAQENTEEFREPFSNSYPIRVEQHIEVKDYVELLKNETINEALNKFQPNFYSIEDYKKSIYPYQRKLENFLGYPPVKTVENGEFTIIKIGEDKFKDIYRVWIEVAEGIKSYGIYMVPKGIKGKAPLIIAVHGGGGNPEAICGLDKRHHYHSFGYEAVKRGYIVWAPGLTMFSGFSGDSTIIDRADLDRQLRLLGGSIMGLEVHKIIESTKSLISKRSEIDKDRIGMTGLSWGAYFTMYATAITPFIKAAAPSGNLRDTEKELNKIFSVNTNNSLYSLHGFGHFEAIGMICPRPILVQMGKLDTVFDINDSRKEAERASKYYENLGISDRFIFHEHEGEHEYDVEPILDFFNRNL